jgi:hypothetical protein
MNGVAVAAGAGLGMERGRRKGKNGKSQKNDGKREKSCVSYMTYGTHIIIMIINLQ